MLEVRSVRAAYEGLLALDDVSIAVGPHEMVAVIGPNGAGKTTLFKVISGTVRAAGGRVTYEDRELLNIPAAERAHLGIAHVPQGRKVFPSMTVYENLEMGAVPRHARGQVRENLDLVFGLFPILAERRSQLAGTLSGGEQQMLALGRGLMSSPKLLMLDEPSMGLAPAITDLIFEQIVAIRARRNVAILLVEQRVAEALADCDRAYVLESGRIVLGGDRESMMADPRIRQAYLGM
jgi:branched-chain amino acid transport system ATP-binding protein